MNDPAVGQTIAQAAAVNLGMAIDQLAAEGAETFLVPNAPNLALVPRIASLNSPSLSILATTLTQLFNSTIEMQLHQVELSRDVDILRFDSFVFSTTSYLRLRSLASRT